MFTDEPFGSEQRLCRRRRCYLIGTCRANRAAAQKRNDQRVATLKVPLSQHDNETFKDGG